MHAIGENIKVIDGNYVRTFSRDIPGESALEVEAGTNKSQTLNECGACRAYLRITNVGGMDMEVRTFGRGGANGFEVVVERDCGLKAILDAMKFMTRVLEEQIMEYDE